MTMTNVRKLVSVLYRELMYQGYTASRISGLRPLNIKRALRVIRYNKLVMGLLSSLYIIIFGTIPYMLREPGLSLVETFLFTFFFVFSSSINITFSLQNIEHIRAILLTLPLEQRLVRRAFALSLYMTMDLPIYFSLATSTALSLITRGVPYPLIGAVEGAFLGIAAAMGFILISERVSRNPVKVNIARTLAITLMIVIIMIGTIMEIIITNPNKLSTEFSFMPVLGGLFINGPGYPLYLTIIYIAIFGVLAYVTFQAATARLINSITHGEAWTVSAKSPRGFRTRNHLIALIMIDLIQSFRSRLAALWSLPLGLWVSLIIFTAEVGFRTIKPLTIFAITTGLAFIASLVPYILYMSEFMGAVVFRLLPISPVKNLLSKVVVTVMTYYVVATPVLIMAVLHGLSLSTQAPVLLAFSLPIDVTAVMANLFERVITEGVMPSALTLLVYAVIVTLTEGIPIASLIITHVLIGGYVIPAVVMLMVSMLEFGVALVPLLR